MNLNWEASYAIAMELRRAHPDANMEEVTLRQVYEWTRALPDFEDDAALANDEILQDIYRNWFEENLEHDRRNY